MGTGRDSKNIFRYIGRGEWKIVLDYIKILFMISKHQYSTTGHREYASEERKFIIKDSFKTPFNKFIGCKLFGHKWSTKDEGEKYDFGGFNYCWKCSDWETKEEVRNSKINSLLK